MTSAPLASAASAPLDIKRICAISLDLDDTLWPIWPTIERAEGVLQEWLLREAPRTASLLLTPGILRELREATAKERSDLAHDLSALRRESIRTALKWLSERYPLVAVSNGNADIHKTGVGRWFRTAFNARAFGSGKPHAPIFRAAAASVGLLPKDVLHVGDDAELDVVGALNAGMQAAWLVRDERPWAHDARPQLIVPNLYALCIALGG